MRKIRLSWVMGALALSVLLLGGRILVEVLWMGLAEARTAEPTVHVISPIPVLGRLPPFALADEQDKAFGTRQLRGSIYVLKFVSAEERRDPSGLHKRLAEVHDAFTRRRVPVRIVLVERGDSTASSRSHLGDRPLARWTVLGGQSEPLWNQVLSLLPVEQERVWTDRMLLVDQSGGVRGFYDLSAHARALSILVEDARCVIACGPIPALADVSPGTVPEGAACANNPSSSP